MITPVDPGTVRTSSDYFNRKDSEIDVVFDSSVERMTDSKMF